MDKSCTLVDNAFLPNVAAMDNYILKKQLTGAETIKAVEINSLYCFVV
jgi:hypothetical protein